jgi:hypothetical protein
MARWKVAARLADELERRRQYRASLVEKHLDGSTGGVDPRKLERALVCTENLIRVDAVMESPKLAE